MRSLKAILSLITIFFLISSCCPRKHKYKYVASHCIYVKYNHIINLHQVQHIPIKYAKIKTFTKEGVFVKEYPLFDKYANWNDTTKYTKDLVLEKPLSTEFDWEVILNDSLCFYITGFELQPIGGMTMFCEHYWCAIKSYKVNGTSVQLITEGDVNSVINIFCKDHLISP